MLKLNPKTWIFLATIIPLMLATRFILPNSLTQLEKGALFFPLIILSIAFFFREIKVIISLRPGSKIEHRTFALPIALALVFLAIWGTQASTFESYTLPFIYFIIIIAYLQTFFEELVFRGLVLNDYLSKNLSITKSIIFTSLIFALFHITYFLKTDDFSSALNQLVIPFIVSFFLGTVYIYCKNIYFNGLLHMFINLSAYFNAIGQMKASQELTFVDFHNIDFVETLISLLGICLFYSPYLLVGLYLLNLMRKENINLPKPHVERPFYIFNSFHKVNQNE